MNKTINFLYNICFSPFNYIWDYIFSIPLSCTSNKIIVLGVSGGSGKTTLAKQLHDKNPEHCIVHIDNCKFGDNWFRYPDDVFVNNVESQLSNQSKYIIEGFYQDYEQPKQQELFNKYLKDADLVIWNDQPLFVSIWRILLRSFKRAVGIEPPGVAPETLASINVMITTNIKTYRQKYSTFNQTWNLKKNSCSGNFLRANWPFYYKA